MVSTMSGCVVTSTLLLLIKMAVVHSGTVVTARGAETLTIYPGIGRYVYYPGPSNWTNAHKACAQSGGHLAIADSNDEADVLFEMISASSVSSVYVHVGYHTRFTGGDYVTVRGKPLATSGFQNYTTSSPPSGYKDMNCGSLYYSTTAVTSGLMLNAPCDKTQPYICELRLWDDYDLISGFGYYKLHKGPRSWQEAEYTCRSEGGFLLVLNSAAERDAVVYKYAAEAGQDGYVWYGAHQRFAYQMFVTIFDEPIKDTGFSTWAETYPGRSSYPYLELRFYPGGTDNNLELNEGSQRPFICKHDLHDLQ